MIIDGIALAEGSSFQNFTIESGAAFPSGATIGELFYLTSGTIGIYCYSGSAWELITFTNTANSSFVNASGDTMAGPLTLAGSPTQDLHAATKAYVDLALTASATGLDFKDSVKVASTANITTSGLLTIDGVIVAAGDRVLVKDNTNQAQNGIYVVATGAWTRASDFNENNEVSAGAYTFVEQGTTNGLTGWALNTGGTIYINTTGLTFSKITSTTAPVVPVPYDIATFCSGKPAISEKLISFKASTAFTIPASFAGSFARCGIPATSVNEVNFSIKKNGTHIVNLFFKSGSGATGNFATTETPTSFAVGDVLTLEAPATQEATLADIMITIKGTVA